MNYIDGDHLHIGERATVDALCERLVAMSAPQLLLFRAAADGRILLLNVLDPGTLLSRTLLKRTRGRATVVLVSDDPDIGDGEAREPEAFACAPALRGWARAVMCHGSGGKPEHYRDAINAAELVRHVVMVETSSTMAPRWAQFLGCPRTLLILPRDGGKHPCRPAGAAEQ